MWHLNLHHPSLFTRHVTTTHTIFVHLTINNLTWITLFRSALFSLFMFVFYFLRRRWTGTICLTTSLIPEGAWRQVTSQRVPDYEPHPRGCLTTSHIPEGVWLQATSQRVPDCKPHPRGCLTTRHIPEGACLEDIIPCDWSTSNIGRWLENDLVNSRGLGLTLGPS